MRDEEGSSSCSAGDTPDMNDRHRGGDLDYVRSVEILDVTEPLLSRCWISKMASRFRRRTCWTCPMVACPTGGRVPLPKEEPRADPHGAISVIDSDCGTPRSR